MTPSHGPRVSLPWAQEIWDVPVDPGRRDSLMRAFPLPTLDPLDRGGCDPEDLVCLAVVLDLLATRLRPVHTDARILAVAAREAINVGLLGGAQGDVVCARLVQLSHSATADARAAFVAAFGHAMLHVLEAPTPGPRANADAHAPAKADAIAAVRASTPQAVAAALGRIARATDLVVREAELLLAQRRARSAWQI